MLYTNPSQWAQHKLCIFLNVQRSNFLIILSRIPLSLSITARFESNDVVFLYVSYEMDTVQQQNGEKIVIFQIRARKKTHTNVRPTAWCTNTYIRIRSVCSWIRFLKQRKFIVHDLNYLERKPKHYYYRILYALNKTAYKTKISVIEVVLKYIQTQLII